MAAFANHVARRMNSRKSCPGSIARDTDWYWETRFSSFDSRIVGQPHLTLQRVTPTTSLWTRKRLNHLTCR